MLEANLRCSSLHLAFQQMLRAKKQSELIQCCGFGGDFREADPDPKRLQKSWEIHIKIDKNYKNIIFFLEKSPLYNKHNHK